jgi:hypothetical protein
VSGLLLEGPTVRAPAEDNDFMVWLRFDDAIFDNTKLAAAGPIGRLIHFACIVYSGRNETDGFVPYGVIRRLIETVWEEVDDGARTVMTASLVRDDVRDGAVLVERTIDNLVALELLEVREGGYIVHDYLKYNPSHAQLHTARLQKQASGKAGGTATAQARGGAGAQAESKPVPVPRSTSTKAPKVLHPSARPLAERLRDLLVANGVRVPQSLDSWAKHADAILRLDKRDPDQAFAVLEWSQRDHFWRKNIHGMEKFRLQYDKLRLGMEESVPQPGQSYPRLATVEEDE